MEKSFDEIRIESLQEEIDQAQKKEVADLDVLIKKVHGIEEILQARRVSLTGCRCF